MKPHVIAVPLGCCPTSPRCLLCPPAEPVSAEVVAALTEAGTASCPSGAAPVVRFFGGAPPTAAQVDALHGVPFEVRVRPDLLTRAEATRLAAAGCRAVELDALTFHDPVLKAAGRTYTGASLQRQRDGLRALGFDVGGVLAPGLPGSSHGAALDDARTAGAQWSFVRIHPVLVLDRSQLRAMHEHQWYQPLSIAEAVDTCDAMMGILEAAGVRVRRVGLQPGPDGMGRAVAGPHDPGFRERVEERRALRTLLDALAPCTEGSVVEVRCAPADIGRLRGRAGINVRTVRARRNLASLRVVADPTLSRPTFTVSVEGGVLHVTTLVGDAPQES